MEISAIIDTMHERIPEKFLKPYNPTETEDRIYASWLESDFFNPDVCVDKGIVDKNAEVFSIVLPPPNVTGTLHIGHASMLAIEDIMIRFARMQGKRTLWLPGTDHAAIATESKVAGIILKEEKKRKQDLGREAFVKRIEEFAQNSHDTIVNQVKKMGSSVDWSREAYTLDPLRRRGVVTAFKKMYDDGLIYRGNRIVNWDPKGQTTISDDEIVYEERQAKLYTFTYSKDFPIPVATTRPETKLGDVGVAVHPEGKYAKYIGQTFTIENFVGNKLTIKVVGDESVDPEFGTGAVGLTPPHSHVDWEMAERHNLPKDLVLINEYGKMTANAGSLCEGKKVAEAREIVVAWLKEQGLLEKEEDVQQNIATAERTGGIIEPLPKLQWFVAVNKPFDHFGTKTTLKELMLNAVKKDDIEILPDRFEKVYFHWIENLRDWCISRQLWFGHRIPVWYHGDEIKVSEVSPGADWIQDEDTLDTWFSSGLWTFSTLGWPEKTKDLETFHPTSVLETGYDILFFWVARMILMSTYLLGEIPFKTVYLHGLVRDGQGRKMSKSLGNIIDPLDMISKYGADATRLSLIIGTGPGNDSKLSEDKIKGYKNFANKLWNITRFVLTVTEGTELKPDFKDFSEKDIALREECEKLLKEITKEMHEYKFYLVAEKLYHYIWHTFADVILEESKPIFAGTDEAAKASRKQLLLQTLEKILKVLHPFMPFVTEEIWSLAPFNKKQSLLLIEKWPI